MEASRTSPYPILIENGMTITTDDEVPAEVFKLLEEAAASVRDAWLEEAGERGSAILDEFNKAKM